MTRRGLLRLRPRDARRVGAGGAATAYGLASANSGETGLRRASAGMAGIAKAGISAAAQPLRKSFSRAASSLQGSAQAGRQAAFATTGGSMREAGGPASSSGFTATTSGVPGISTAVHAVLSLKKRARPERFELPTPRFVV